MCEKNIKNMKINILKKENNNHKCRCLNASMTLETAMVLPIFIFGILTLISLMEMMRFYSDMEQRITGIGKEISVYSAAAKIIGDKINEDNLVLDLSGHVASSMTAYYKVVNSYSEEELWSAGIANGKRGITNIFSRIMVDNDIVDLVFTYRLVPRANFFSYRGYFLINRCRMRAWTGYGEPENIEESERYVYVTETGTVFHLTDTCTYLDLSITPMTYEETVERRNFNGEIYKSCEVCKPGSLENDALVFITNYGDCYHNSLGCSGLKRTISYIPISEVGDRRACSRCGR